MQTSRMIPGNIKSEWSNIRRFIEKDELRKTGSLQSDQEAKEFTRKELPEKGKDNRQELQFFQKD